MSHELLAGLVVCAAMFLTGFVFTLAGVIFSTGRVAENWPTPTGGVHSTPCENSESSEGKP